MQKDNPENMARAVVEGCADCDVCRYLMEDTLCLVFPEIYRLYDKEAVNGGKITAEELRSLVDLCNFCALCPCPNVRADLMKAKHAFVARDGLKPAIRLLEDVGRLARLCGSYPRLANSLLEGKRIGGFFKKLTGIHPARNLPKFPKGNFPSWAMQQGLHTKNESKGKKVAYFAGCTAQYLFPDVPKAVVEVLRKNEIEVYFPEQKCCGMPSLLEGDLKLTLEFAAFNLDQLCNAVDSGYQIVCSCPTCAYMLKHVMSEGAFYSKEYRDSTDPGGSVSNETGANEKYQPGRATFAPSVITNLFEDEGYFASLDALKRIKVASHTFDLGEYLRDLHRAGNLNTDLGPVPGKMAYYPPCHLREQKIGQPYAELMSLLPGMSLETIDGAFYCCGIAGIMGFKRDFYPISVVMGSHLVEKITAINPERLITDCLSCRIQFDQLIPYKVFHPIEVIYRAYDNCQHRKKTNEYR